MRFTEKQIFDAGVVHGYLIAKQNMVFAKMGSSEFTRRLVEGQIWKDFQHSNPERAVEYQEFSSKWKGPKSKKGR